MPLGRNLDPTDALCPDCHTKLDIVRCDRYSCPECGERKFRELA